MKNIAVFASGGGTDFQSVIDANARGNFCVIKYLIASKPGIGAIERAEKAGIEARVFAKADYPSLEDLYQSLAALLEGAGVDYIVLAGWLKIIPASFIERFRDRIINIHPSLIPSFCGKGYYGLKVHEAGAFLRREADGRHRTFRFGGRGRRGDRHAARGSRPGRGYARNFAGAGPGGGARDASSVREAAL